MNELIKPEPMQIERQQPTIADMMQAAIAAGITENNVAVIERLAALYERSEAKDAEKEFAAAFNQLQADMPEIVASSSIPNRGKYERFEDIMRKIRPALIANGFSISFNQSQDGGRYTETCTLSHRAGFSRSNSFSVRSGGKADSEAQADCKASTTAKRRALQDALGIVIHQETLNDEHDATIEGSRITQDQADELEHRVKMLGDALNLSAFWKFAGATSFSEIPANKLASIRESLARKESGK